mmetsp:Transcript_24199/g.21302  ORF Transcript_24199/g.21302 Transcript_24199/m.21302 type:complete len:89 (+) Transcript_24199:56-322(+)
MGIYLATPNKQKDTVEDSFGQMKYAATGMQGWRVHMEDAHISKFNIDTDTHLFGVFDGHGGKEVAKFVERHFVEEFLKNSNYKSKKYE